MYFQMGWRNIWRNRRRTLVILTAVVIGVWSMIFLGSLMRGIAVQIVKNGIATLTGHIQIHQKGYRNDPAIENSMLAPQEVKDALASVLPPHARWTSRVRVNAVVSNARHSTGAVLVGIDPGRESGISFIGNAVTEGSYLAPGDEAGIVVGRALAEQFETQVGRKLVIMSQDTNGEIASRAFRIEGIYQAELEATEKQFLFVTLTSAQEMLRLDGGISEVSIVLPSDEEVGPLRTALQEALAGRGYEVSDWRELLPMASAVLAIYDWFIFIWFLVAFIAMAFGIVNTTLMAVFERMREFGLLKALGMRPFGIVKEVLTESLFLLIIGTLVGNTLGFLGVYALSNTGIDLSMMAKGLEYAGMSRVIYPVILGKDVALANLVVFALGLLVSLYPAIKAARFSPVEAMAHT